MGPGIQFAGPEPLPTVAHAGLAWAVLNTPLHNLTLATDISYQTTTAIQQYSFGTEYWYDNMFAVRAGYLANSQEEGLSAGFGIRYSFLEFDYAYEPYNILGSVNRFSGLIQWDGPWISGGEPNTPKFVTVEQTAEGLKIRWQKALGPVKSYEVLIQPAGGELFVSAPVFDTTYEYKNIAPDTLYHVSVKSLGGTGAQSFAVKETQILTLSQAALAKKFYQQQNDTEAVETAAKGLYGKVESLGLRLSWAASSDRKVVGYNLYRQSPNRPIEKVTQTPKQTNRVWVAGVSGDWGSKWTVTEVRKDGREKTLGTYLWHPTPEEINKLSMVSNRHLKAIPQPDRQVFLVWDGDPDATGYTLYYSHNPDGVYELYQEIKKVDTNLLLNIPAGIDTYYFIVVPQKTNDQWSLPTQEAKVLLYEEPPVQ
jgi:hypothetical protein